LTTVAETPDYFYLPTCDAEEGSKTVIIDSLAKIAYPTDEELKDYLFSYDGKIKN
jgi:hypothetical protein